MENLAAEEKKSKKFDVGYFFLGLTPGIACYALQIVIGVMVMIPYALINQVIYQTSHPMASQSEIMNYYMQKITDGAPYGIVAYHIISIPVFALWYYFGCKKPKLKASLKNVTAKAVIIGLVGGVVLCFFNNAFVGLDQYLMPGQFQKFLELQETAGMTGENLFVNFAAILLAPIGEELICRGLTFYYMKKALGNWMLANLLQALVFGCIHGNVVQGLYAFVIGLMLGYLAERFHTLIPCMLMHFSLNLSATYLAEPVLASCPNTALFWAGMFVITIVLAALLVIWGGLPASQKKEASS